MATTVVQFLLGYIAIVSYAIQSRSFSREQIKTCKSTSLGPRRSLQNDIIIHRRSCGAWCTDRDICTPVLKGPPVFISFLPVGCKQCQALLLCFFILILFYDRQGTLYLL